MNITRENLNELDFQIKIDVVESDYAEAVTKQLKKMQRSAMIPGFRKGMAPMGLIQRMYKTSVVADEVQQLLSESIYKYLTDEKLDIVGSPLSNDEKTGAIDFDNNKDFTFYFDAAMSPKFDLAWDKVDAKLYQVKVSPKDIDKQIDDITKRFGEFSTPEIIGEKDFVYGKAVELDKEGKHKEGGVETFMSFSLDEVKNAEEISPLFVGKKEGDVVVFNPSKAFTASEIEQRFRISSAAAKKFKSDVEFTVSGCSRIVPHEVNETLFEKVFPGKDVKDLSSFRKLVSADIESTNNEQAQLFYVNEVRKSLMDNFNAPMPESFLKRWILSRDEKLTAETLDAEWEEKYIPSLKWEFVDSALNDIKPLAPTHDEVVAYVKDILSKNDVMKEGEDEKDRDIRLNQAANSIASSEENVSQIRDRLYSQKSYQLFVEQLKPEVEKVSLKDLADKLK